MYSLDDWIRRFDLLYGVRNRYGILAISELCLHLNISVRVLSEVVMRERGVLTKEQAIADVCGWVMAFVNYFPDLPLVEEFAKKYGMDVCPYCSNRECSCLTARDKRPAFTLSKANVKYVQMDIHEWQLHLGRLYGSYNRKDGALSCLLRLSGEVSEMMANIRSFSVSGRHSIGARRQLIADELRDILAWVFAVANVLEIDLGGALMERYGKKFEDCSCQKFLCDCGFLLRWQTGMRAFDPLKGDDEKANSVPS